MSRIITVTHPASVRFVAKYSRREEWEQAKAVSAVELRDAPYGAFRPFGQFEFRAPPMFASFPLFAHEGNAWAMLESGGRAVTPAALADLLEEGTGLHEYDMMGQFFTGTPVCALNKHGRVRGTPLELLRVKEMVDDGTDAARIRLQAFFDGNVRTAADRVFVRLDLLAACDPRGDYFHAVPFPQSQLRAGAAAHPDHAEAMWRFAKAEAGGHAPALAKARKAFAREYATFPGALVPGDADLRHTLNNIVRTAVDVLGELVGMARGDDKDSAARVLARLRPHAHAAMTGDLDPGLAEPVLEAATAAYGEIIMAPAWPRLTPISKIQTEQTHLQVRYLHEVLMPRLVSHALSDDDATAFDGLGPAM